MAARADRGGAAGNSEALDENTARMLNDLTQSLGSGDDDGLQGMEEDGDGEGGEPDQNVKMQVSGKRGKGRTARESVPRNCAACSSAARRSGRRNPTATPRAARACI